MDTLLESVNRETIFHYFFFFLATPHSLLDLSSPKRDGTCTLALEAWSLNHWTTREVPLPLF